MKKATSVYTAKTLPGFKHKCSVSLTFDTKLSSVPHDIATSFCVCSYSCFSSLLTLVMPLSSKLLPVIFIVLKKKKKVTKTLSFLKDFFFLIQELISDT